MRGPLWRARIPEWVRRLTGQDALLARLQVLEDRLRGLETELTAVRDTADHAERVAIPSVSSRARTLEEKINYLETVETRMLHRKSSELRRDLDLLNEDARRMFEYWEVRTDNIYASLVSRLPELARGEDES